MPENIFDSKLAIRQVRVWIFHALHINTTNWMQSIKRHLILTILPPQTKQNMQSIVNISIAMRNEKPFFRHQINVETNNFWRKTFETFHEIRSAIYDGIFWQKQKKKAHKKKKSWIKTELEGLLNMTDNFLLIASNFPDRMCLSFINLKLIHSADLCSFSFYKYIPVVSVQSK